MANTTPAGTIEEQRDALRKQQADAQQQAEAAAARLTLLDGLAKGEAAWSAGKERYLADLEALWNQVKACPDTLKKALGEESARLQSARDGYGGRVGELEKDLNDKRKTADEAQDALDTAQQTLKADQDAFAARFGDVASAMSLRLSRLADLVTQLKAAMGGTPCDAKTAYLLALDIQDEHKAIAEEADADLAREVAAALGDIKARQNDVATRIAEKTAADDAVLAAQRALDSASQDRYGTIVEMAKAAPAPAAPPVPPPAPAAGP